MSSYKDTGLDEFGNVIDTPLNSGTITSAYEFDSTNDRGAVSAYHIRDFSFNSGQGGTLTLGGTSNVSGYFQIKNESGSVIVTGDNTGLTVNSGSITVKDTGGTTVIDYLGLNSGNNFYSDSATGGSFDTSSTSMVNVTGGTLSSLVLSRATKCFVYVAINGSNDKVDESCAATVYDTYSSGTLTNFVANFNGQYDGSSYFNQLVFLGRIFEFVAGTHALNLQLKTSPGGTAHMAGWELGLLRLGN